MGGSSSILKPQELTEFRKLNTTIENIEIPARPESRSLTDKKGFLFFGIPILIFIPFLVYALVKSDIRRIHYDYDSCGNLCGHTNEKINDIACSGVDHVFQPYSYRRPQGLYNKSTCVSSCPSGTELERLPMRCLRLTPKKSSNSEFGRRRFRRDEEFNWDEESFSNTLQGCKKTWWKFLAVFIITIALSLIMLCLMRFTPTVLVWGIIALSVIVAIGASIGLWYGYFRDEEPKNKALLVGAVALTIFTLIIIVMLVCLFRKIRLVILLFEEATKAVFAMPLLIFVPIIVTLVQFIILALFITTTLWMSTARELHKYEEDYYEYEMTGVLIFAIVFNVIMTFWTMEFIAGFQYMTVSGSVASWFFTTNKQYLGSPISTSFLNAVRFHTGTIAFGSFILVLMAVVRALIRTIIDNEKLRCLVECCCANVEAFLKFLSCNAYIETAIHGQSFLRSGRRAAKLLLSNAGSVIAINSVGDFVLGMIQFLVVIISTGIAAILFKNLHHFWFPTLICFFVNVIIVAIVFGVFSTTIDTLFICFCEDKTINDGISRPYYMSRGLMEFIENSKKIYGDK